MDKNNKKQADATNKNTNTRTEFADDMNAKDTQAKQNKQHNK